MKGGGLISLLNSNVGAYLRYQGLVQRHSFGGLFDVVSVCSVLKPYGTLTQS